ncbi:MAG: diaminopimelate decarboxylase [Clostridia bacterium]|nr:diaminopimelate decarboxylase [Clostridia bacterium]MDY2929270.1 diaminopimelate decarboxylase [Clostridiaceae bacterium]
MNNYYSDHFTIEDDGHLHLDGVDLVEVAKQYGTPVYVMSEKQIRENCRAFTQAMARNFGEKYKVAYASKALCAKFIYRILQSEGIHADVVSGGELYTALKAGFDPKHLHFHGNNKTVAELEMGVDCGIGSIIIDAYEEVERLEAVCAARGVHQRVLFRVKPGVHADTHEFISTGQNDSKFGFGIEDGEAMRLARHILEQPHLDFAGIHCHIGSQVFSVDAFARAAKIMFDFFCKMEQELNIHMDEMIIGGGFGVKYMPSDEPGTFGEKLDAMGKAMHEEAAKYGREIPEIVIEPGRSMVCAAGCTLYTVGSVRDIKDARTYVSVDGGMIDNPRFVLYGAEYDAVVANRANAPRDKVQTIAGRCCESGDLVARDLKFQTAKAEDIICTFATGAYNFSMASNYNRVPRPSIILVKEDGTTAEVVRRQTYEDLISCDL